MLMDTIYQTSAVNIRQRILQGELSPVEVVESLLQRIERLNPRLNSFITVDAEGALDTARRLEKNCDSPGPLHGIPIAIKDLSYTKGLRTTCGSLTLKDNVPTQDSISVERIRQAGAIIIGKTNTPEFGYKGVTDNRLMPPTVNPWDESTTSGGSSGGSASAVAAGLVPLAEGTDGAGSIRIPASFCGVVGFKPSFASVPRYPIPDIYYTLSHTGPIARNVEDAALLYSVLAGQDMRDALSFDVAASQGESQLKLAWTSGLSYAQAEPEVAKVCREAVYHLTEQRHTIVEDRPEFPDPEPIELNIWNTVYAARYGPLTSPTRELFTPELAEIVDEGMRLPAHVLCKDSIARTKLYYTMDEFFQKYDLLLMPTMPMPSFPVELQHPRELNGRKLDTLFGWTPFTYPFNLTGQPAITVPVTYVTSPAGKKLPVGVQIIGPRGSDNLVLAVAKQLESYRTLPALPTG